MSKINVDIEKILKKYKEYDGLKNPKEMDLIFEKRVKLGGYEQIKKPDFNMNVFNHNYQKYEENTNINQFFEFTN